MVIICHGDTPSLPAVEICIISDTLTSMNKRTHRGSGLRDFLDEEGLLGKVETRALKQAVSLPKPVTAALIKRGRGILKRKPGEKPLAADWAEHQHRENNLEDRLAR